MRAKGSAARHHVPSRQQARTTPAVRRSPTQRSGWPLHQGKHSSDRRTEFKFKRALSDGVTHAKVKNGFGCMAQAAAGLFIAAPNVPT